MVEFVVVLGVFLSLVLGLVCVGQVLLANYAVSQAARAGAHQAAIGGGTAAEISAVARLAAAQVLDAGVGTRAAEATITATCPRTPCRRYDPITVSVAYSGAFWTPLPPLFTRFSVQATATRAAERDQGP